MNSPENQLTQSILNLSAQEFNELAEKSELYLARLEQRGQARPKMHPAQRLLLAGTAAALMGAGLAALRPPAPSPEKNAAAADAPARSPILNPTFTPPATPKTEAGAKPTLEPTKAHESPPTIMAELLHPIVEKARIKRQQREANDPEYTHRVDRELNKDRINVLLFSYGENYFPANDLSVEIGTNQIISINTTTYEIDLISITHDTRAPESEWYLRSKGQTPGPMKIDAPYKTGGFSLMRETFENATGLAMDYQLVLKEATIRDIVDQVLGSVQIENPFAFSTEPISVEGKKYDAAGFTQGKASLNGIQALQYMKGADEAGYISERGPHQRKHIVVEGLKKALENNLSNPSFWFQLLTFFTQQKKNGNLALDFDETKLIPNIPKLLSSLATSRNQRSFTIGQSIFIMDTSIGDGGVQWITFNAETNPHTKKDIEEGVYPELAMEVPLKANPYATDLVADYWGSTRTLVRERLLGKP